MSTATIDRELERRRALGPICGVVRPRDSVTTCTRALGHDGEHMHHVYADGNVDATWGIDGREACDCCGHSIDLATGMCTAPRSIAD